MQAVIEVTKWDMDLQPNHTYLLDSDRVHAYIPEGTNEPVYFSKPLRIEVKGRKFKELKINPFKVTTKSTLIEVKGSKGDTYFVDPEKGSCSCSGWKFRGTCKHIKEVLE
jgi:hypothetical protein